MDEPFGANVCNTPTPASFCWFLRAWLWVLQRLMWPGVLHPQTADRQISIFKVEMLQSRHGEVAHGQTGSLRISGIKQ